MKSLHFRLDFARGVQGRDSLVLLPVVVLPVVVELLPAAVVAELEADVVTEDPDEADVDVEAVADVTELEPELERAGPPEIRNRCE